MNECCGLCKFHQHEDVTEGWICTNPDSEYIADWTEYEDSCDCFEERD